MKSGTDLGSQVRAFRKKRKLSLTALSQLTGIAASNLSSIELNKTSPTLSTLVKIADAFHLRVGAFLDEALYHNAVTCAYGEAKLEKSTSRGATVALLTSGIPMGNLQVRVFSLEPHSEQCPLGGEGTDRFLYCVHGLVTAHVDGESLPIEELDGLYLRSDASATIENSGSGTAVVLCAGNASR